MKTFSKARVTCLAGAALVLGTLCTTSTSAVDDEESRGVLITARANIQGAPGSGISGFVTFVQTSDGILPTVKVFAFVRGLPPNTVHGFHIHEIGNCANTTVPFGGAGGHSDGPPPAAPPNDNPAKNSNPDTNHPYHMGDLPPLKANSYGIAVLEHRTSRITLSPSPLSIFDADGSAVIVHANPDQGIPGAAGSGVSGGPRIACGIIGR